MVAKAVRMVSALNAAALLADNGFTTEVASLLRIVTDLANEIIAVGEGVLRGTLTRSQQDFVDQFFRPVPTSLEEFRAREKASYVSRKEIYKAHKRLAAESPADGEKLVEIGKFLDQGYDSYVHGGYATAMELYEGCTESFMVSGHRSDHHRCVASVSLAQKLFYAILALELMAMSQGATELVSEIRTARHELESAPEYQSDYCK